MAVTREALLAALDTYIDPLIGKGLVAAGCVKKAEPGGLLSRPSVEIELAFPAAGYRAELTENIEQAVRAAIGDVPRVQISWNIESHAVQRNLQPLAGIKNIIAVASGKGGVGKSTVAVNLALALLAEGAKVGLLDADIYGPSQPRMLGVAAAKPSSPDGRRMNPILAHGLQVMSIGFLIDEDQPMVWRGPMVTQALNQLLGETAWSELDYLVVDLPPGTGDIQLTLSQKIPVSGAIIVTTPQDIALLDARKGLQMFRKVEVSVLGVVENMAIHICTNCGHAEHIFGEGGGARLAADYGTELLGALPLSAQIRARSDAGQPIVVSDPESDAARRFRAIARLATARLAYSTQGAAFPSIEIGD